MTRVPLLSGSRVAAVEVPDDGIVLRPPPPGDAIDDVSAAVREALRFPLAGPPHGELARRYRKRLDRGLRGATIRGCPLGRDDLSRQSVVRLK